MSKDSEDQGHIVAVPQFLALEITFLNRYTV